MPRMWTFEPRTDLHGVVEGVLNFFDDEFGHAAVDVAGEFDEAGFNAGFFTFPGKIKRIDGNAVAAEPGTGIKRHEAEWFGGGGVDDFPHVNVHARRHDGEFVDEADVDHAESVFEQLDHFRDARGTDGNNCFQGLLIEERACLRCTLG